MQDSEAAVVEMAEMLEEIVERDVGLHQAVEAGAEGDAEAAVEEDVVVVAEVVKACVKIAGCGIF